MQKQTTIRNLFIDGSRLSVICYADIIVSLKFIDPWAEAMLAAFASVKARLRVKRTIAESTVGDMIVISQAWRVNLFTNLREKWIQNGSDAEAAQRSQPESVDKRTGFLKVINFSLNNGGDAISPVVGERVGVGNLGITNGRLNRCGNLFIRSYSKFPALAF